MSKRNRICRDGKVVVTLAVPLLFTLSLILFLDPIRNLCPIYGPAAEFFPPWDRPAVNQRVK